MQRRQRRAEEALSLGTRRVGLLVSLDTTGLDYFAECLTHSAKAGLHLAKALPSVTLSKPHSAKPLTAKGTLPSATSWALGKEVLVFPNSHREVRKRIEIP